MGFSLGNLLYEIKLKNRQLKQGIDESKRKVGEFDNHIDKSKKKLAQWSDTAKTAGLALTGFAVGVGAAGFKLAKVAGEAEDTEAKFKTVFKGMDREASAFVANFADKFDLADSSVQEWLATLKDTFDPLGIAEKQSMEWGKTLSALALDVKTFYPSINSVNDAINRFTSYLVGNHEAVREMGVVVNEAMLKQEAYSSGIAETGEELTEVQKMTARYNLLLNGLQNAQGNAMRELDNFNMALTQIKETWKAFQEEYGEELMPMFTEFINTLKSILKYLKDLPDSTQRTIAKFVTWGTASAAVTGPLLLIVGYLPQIATGLSMISANFTPFLIGGAIVAGLTFIVNKFNEWRENVELLKKDLKSLDEDSASKRLQLLEQDKESLKSRAKVMTWGSGNTWQEWIEENKKEEWDNLNAQIDATKSYIAELERQKQVEKEIAEQKQRQLQYGMQVEQDLNNRISTITNPEQYYDQFGEGAQEMKEISPWSADKAIGELEDYKKFFEEMPDTDMFGDAIDWDNLSEEKRLDLIAELNEQILRLEHKKAAEVEKIDEQLSEEKMKLREDDYDYQIHLLEQEKQAVIDSYYEQLGSTQEWLAKKKEAEQVYGEMIARIEEERTQKEKEEEMKRLQFQLEQNEIELSDYIDYLDTRITEEEQYTDQWYQLMRERQNALNESVNNEIQKIKEQSNEMYDNEKDRIMYTISKLKELKNKYSDNKVILALINDLIVNMKSNLDGVAEGSKFEQWLMDIGLKADTAKQIFDTMYNGLVDGLTDAITEGENFLDILDNIAKQIAKIVIKRSIVEPLVSSLFPTAHTGAVVTTAGLVRDLPTYHSGGKIKPDERIIKVQTGERILSRSQNKDFENGKYGSKTEIINNINNNITAMDSQDVMRALTKDGGSAVAAALGLDFSSNGPSRRIIKGGS